MEIKDLDSIQSHRNKIKEYAERFGIDLLFKEDIQQNGTFLTLKWVSGQTSIYQYEIHPEILEDGNLIKVNPKLRHTVQKSPAL